MTAMLEHPQTMDAPGSARFEELRRTLEEMDVPDGYRAEIIGRNIVMSPWSQGYCLPIMRSIRRQLEPHAPEGHIADSSPYLFTFPASERGYGPDVYVAHERAFQRRQRYIPGDALSLVAELTSSSTRDRDRDDKTPVYGRNGVPVYLLLDMQEHTTTVFWTPSEHGYVSRLTVPFGETVHIPAPFDCDLDTSGFVLTEADETPN